MDRSIGASLVVIAISHRRRLRAAGLALAALVCLALPAWRIVACPFCSAIQTTLSEDIQQSEASVLAKLVARNEKPDPTAMTNATFEIQTILKGADALKDQKQIEGLYFGEQPVGTIFLMNAIGPAPLAWSTPTPLNQRAADYVAKLPSLAEKGGERLRFFQEYLEDEDPMLAADAYDEFARAPYDDVKSIKDSMHRDRLLRWAQDPATATHRRRLYLTMLGVCGQADDIAALEDMLRKGDGSARPALDATIASYLCLKGAEGLPLVEDLFLKNLDAEFVDTYSAIMAIRFHGQETTIIPRERLCESLRYVLDNPKLADQVIGDLARWQDWSVIDKLVTLFKDAQEGDNHIPLWIRVAVARYLQACPLPEAKERLAELEQIDPDRVRQAKKWYVPGSLTPKNQAVGQRPADKQKPTDEKAKAEDETPKPELPAEEASFQQPTPGDDLQVVKVAAMSQVAQPASSAERIASDDTAAPRITAQEASRATKSSKRSDAVASVERPAPVADVGVTGSPLAIFGYSAAAGAMLWVLMTLVLRGGQSPL